MESPLLSIIYVNFQSVDLIRESILSLKKNTAGFEYEIIVVNNDTEIDKEEFYKYSSSETRSSQPSVSNNINLINVDSNQGFGAGCNLGAKKARGEYLLFLNPDTLIVDASIAKLVSFLQKHPEVGAVTPLLYMKDQQTSQRHFFSDFLSLRKILFDRKTKSSPDCHPALDAGSRPNCIDSGSGSGMTIKNELRWKEGKEFFYSLMISGAAMMIKKSNFEKVGGFDENFFMYLEDDDLCRRLTNINLKNAVLATAKVIHLEESENTDRSKRRLYYQSQNYYFMKYYGLFATLLMRLMRFPYKLLKLVS